MSIFAHFLLQISFQIHQFSPSEKLISQHEAYLPHFEVRKQKTPKFKQLKQKKYNVAVFLVIIQRKYSYCGYIFLKKHTTLIALENINLFMCHTIKGLQVLNRDLR